MSWNTPFESSPPIGGRRIHRHTGISKLIVPPAGAVIMEGNTQARNPGMLPAGAFRPVRTVPRAGRIYLFLPTRRGR
jgi:hypothetical protein